MTDQEYSEFIKKHVYLNEETLGAFLRGEITMPTFSPFFESDSGPVPPKDSVISNNSSFGKVGIDPKYLSKENLERIFSKNEYECKK